MPRFRNTTSPIVTEVLPENGSAMRRSNASSDICMTPAYPSLNFPTPSPSPVSVSPSSCPSPSPSLSSYTPSPSPSLSSPPTSIPPSTPKHKRLPSSTSTSTSSQHHIPRPRNAFILFRSHVVSNGLAAGLSQQNLISREAGRLWRAVDKNTREEFQAMAKEEKRVHKAKWPEYRYAPGPRKGEGMDEGKIKTESGGMKKETKMKTKTKTKTSARRTPIQVQERCKMKTRTTKPRRTLPTPDVTPEPSVPPPRLTLVLQETEAQINHEPEIEPFHMDEDIETDDYYFPPFNVFADTPFQDVIDREPKQPEFTFPPPVDDFVIDSNSIPCLASSTYSIPTFIHVDRRLLSSPTSSPTSNFCFSIPQHNTEAHELAKRALRPSAPLWHLDLDVSKQKPRDDLGSIHTVYHPSSSLPPSAELSSVYTEMIPTSTFF